jgi:hypothetical protein
MHHDGQRQDGDHRGKKQTSKAANLLVMLHVYSPFNVASSTGRCNTI